MNSEIKFCSKSSANSCLICYFIMVWIIFLSVCGIEKNVVGASLMPAIASTPQLAVTVIGES